MATRKLKNESSVVPVKKVRVYNSSFQGLEVHYKTQKNPETEWLPPQKSIVIDEWQVTDQIKNLLRRRVLEFRRP
jgi:hypothetical protein